MAAIIAGAGVAQGIMMTRGAECVRREDRFARNSNGNAVFEAAGEEVVFEAGVEAAGFDGGGDKGMAPGT